jgi:hypothetical protein
LATHVRILGGGLADGIAARDGKRVDRDDSDEVLVALEERDGGRCRSRTPSGLQADTHS